MLTTLLEQGATVVSVASDVTAARRAKVHDPEALLPAEARADFGMTRYQASALLTFKFNHYGIRDLVMAADPSGYREAA